MKPARGTRLPLLTTYRREHLLFIVTAVVITLIVFVGFAQSYFLSSWMGGHSLSRLLQLHGFLMSSWVVMFMLQVSLVLSGNLATHRRLGVLGAPLAFAIFILGMAVVIRSMNREVPHAVNLVSFAAFDGLHLIAFILLASGALALRHSKSVHKRLMVYATMSLLPPALGRLIGHYGGNDAVAAGTLATMIALTSAFVAVDIAVCRRWFNADFIGSCALVITSLATYAAQKAT